MSDQCPRIWAEENPPAGVEDCTDCGLYKHGSRVVWGEGNPDAPIMVVLDNPGAREKRDGTAFVCGTRETLQQAVLQAGLGERDVYVTYVLKRRPTKAYDKAEARTICMQHLLAQLESKSPRIVLCLGNVAAQMFFGDQEADVKTLRQAWHLPRGVKTAVSYHPLAVRRRPNLWPAFLADWEFVVSGFKNKEP